MTVSGDTTFYVHIPGWGLSQSGTITTTGTACYPFPSSPETPWECPKCGATQLPSEVETTATTKAGKEPEITYYGKIRPSYIDDNDDSYLEYECLVCSYVWDNFSDDDPDPDEPDDVFGNITWIHAKSAMAGEFGTHVLERDAC